MNTTKRTIASSIFVAAFLLPVILLFSNAETISQSSAEFPAKAARVSDAQYKPETTVVSDNYCFRLIKKIFRETFSFYQDDSEQIYWEWVNLQESNLDFEASYHALDNEWPDENLFLFGPNMHNTTRQTGK